MNATPTIGTYQEKSLHAALKDWYASPGDLTEHPVDGYVVDLVRGNELIEIQTRNFAAIKRKLSQLLEEHPVRLVHPIPTTEVDRAPGARRGDRAEPSSFAQARQPAPRL